MDKGWSSDLVLQPNSIIDNIVPFTEALDVKVQDFKAQIASEPSIMVISLYRAQSI